MIARNGVLFEYGCSQTTAEADNTKTSRSLDGDSDVGQASEFPPRFLSSEEPQIASSPSDSESPRNDTGFGIDDVSIEPISFFERQIEKLKPQRYILTTKWFSTFGTGLIIFAVLGFLFTFGPILKVELNYRISRLFDPHKEVRPTYGFDALLNQTEVYAAEEVPDPNFSLIIPKILAKAKVVADVDPTDEQKYMEALKSGVAHAKGTYFPGSHGNIYLFAHSTDNPLNVLRYNAVFFLLKEMDVGDEVDVYFAGVKHRYFVTGKKIIEPNDLSYITPTNPEGEEQLVLQTCWPPGTTLKRLVVLAKKKII